jgi:hypothetical protein
MPSLFSTIRQACTRRHLTTLLCVLLLVFGTTLQMTHAHSSGESHADCSLCVTAHAATTVPVPQIALVLPAALAETPPPAPTSPRVPAYCAHPLSIRPPPAVAAA